MEPLHWYVKLGEESVGPLTTDELKELIRIGSIVPQTSVSTNQRDWIRAGESPSLTFDSATPFEVPTIPTRQTPAAPKVWHLIAASAVVLLVIFVIVRAGTTPETLRSLPPTAGSASTHNLQAADRTYQYWKQVSGIFREAAAAPAGVSTFRSSAAAVEAVPTAGIDPDAVNCALGFSALLKECADLVQSENDPSATADQILRAFYGGWSGDFQPLVRDLETRNDAHKSLASHVKNAEQQLIQTRAILSSRYGIEFPPL